MSRDVTMAEGGCHELDVAEKITRELQKLVALRGGGSFIWTVVGGTAENIGDCSDDLKPYQEAFENEVALAMPMEITPIKDALPATYETFGNKAKTKHTDLHPIVAVLMAKLNEINGHNAPRTMALSQPDTIPAWFPHNGKIYAERAQAMSLPQLFQVLDAIFRHVRRHVAKIDSLHGALVSHFRVSSLNTRTRACFEAYFDFLKKEAAGPGGTPQVDHRAQGEGFGGVGRSPRDETPRGGSKVSKVMSPRRGQKLPIPATASDAPETGRLKKEPGIRTGSRTGLRSGDEAVVGGLLPARDPHPSETVFGDGNPGGLGTPTTETPANWPSLGDQKPGDATRSSPPKRVRSMNEIFRDVFGSGANQLEGRHFVKKPRETAEYAAATVTVDGRKTGRRRGKRGKVPGNSTDTVIADVSGFLTVPRVPTPHFDPHDPNALAVAAAAVAALSDAGSGGMVAESSGGILTEGSAGMVSDELGGTVWDDADSEHGSFDEYLDAVTDWREVVRSGLRAEVGGTERRAEWGGTERRVGPPQRTVSDGFALLNFARGAAATRDVSPAARGRARSLEWPALQLDAAVDVADFRAWERSIGAVARFG